VQFLDEADYLHHMFSNKSNEYRSPFDVQSQCEKLVAGDSMWRISQVNKSYRVCFSIYLYIVIIT